jgi:predicted type IV restriction endonuclease
MKDILNDIVQHLKKGDYKNEEHVRVGIVFRLLQALGWNIWNPQEVWPEFPAIPEENSTRVDVALFKPSTIHIPAVFIEVKAVGKLAQNLEAAERQLRDYNVNNQAEIVVLTDGRAWRFYLPSAAGTFQKKCFQSVDLLTGDAEDFAPVLQDFLSRESLESGHAIEQAHYVLKRTAEQRTMDALLPQAKEAAQQDLTVSVMDCFVHLCAERGISRELAKKYIRESSKNSPKQPALPVEHAAADNRVHADLPPVQEPLVEKNAKPDLSGKRACLSIPQKGVYAEGKVLSDGKQIIVFAGALAKGKNESLDRHSYGKLHTKLVADNILKPKVLPNGTNGFELTRDYTFNALSAAAAILTGHPADGPKLWKEKK